MVELPTYEVTEEVCKPVLDSQERYDRLLDIIGGLLKMEKRYLNVKELSEHLGVSKHTIYSWISMRRIPFVKMGGLVRFDIKAIEKWIKENSVEVSGTHKF